MPVTAELAQRIVTIAMAVAHRNVNIMDPRGVIIASGHPSRIGTLHAGAREAAASNRVVEIAPTEVPQYSGALEGINMPIVVAGNVVAVVGVYGNPRPIRPVARLVRQIASHILEREEQYRQFEGQVALREELLGHLLNHGEGAVPAAARPLAASLGFDADRPRFLLLASIGVERPAAPFPEEYRLPPLVSLRLAEIESMLHSRGLLSASDFLGVCDRRLVVLSDAAGSPSAAEIGARALAVHSELAHFLGQLVLCGVSGIGAAQELPLLFQQGKFALSWCGPGRRVASIDEPDILLPWLRLVGLSRSGQIAMAPLAARLARVFASRPALRETVVALLAATLDASVAAARVGVHRNTLAYRLHQFEAATGLVPQRRFDDAVLCSFLLAAMALPPA